MSVGVPLLSSGEPTCVYSGLLLSIPLLVAEAKLLETPGRIGFCWLVRLPTRTLLLDVVKRQLEMHINDN